MALFKILLLVAVLVVLAVQLEYLFRTSKPLREDWPELADRFICTAFVVGFILWLYLAYEIARVKRLISQYGYVGYKKNDDWQQEMKQTTKSELSKLCASEPFKQWQRSRVQQHFAQPTNAQQLGQEEQQFFTEVETKVFEDEPQHLVESEASS